MAGLTSPSPIKPRNHWQNVIGAFLKSIGQVVPWENVGQPPVRNQTLGVSTAAPDQMPIIDEPRRLALEKHGQNIPQPPENIANIFWNTFPQDATRSAVVAQSESGYNPTPKDFMNRDLTTDRGLFQINSATFEDFMKRKGKKLKAEGIYNYEQMLDPVLNAKMAKIIQEEQGWDAWYGPKFKGYDMSQREY